jgi:hypothetical protein
MSNDIGRYGVDGDGREAYWVQWSGYSSLGGGMFLRLVVIDQFGAYEETPLSQAYDRAAPTLDEAIIAHLQKNGVVNRAEADLDRRRQEAPEEPEEQPPPPDPATQRFMDDDSIVRDLTLAPPPTGYGGLNHAPSSFLDRPDE